MLSDSRTYSLPKWGLTRWLTYPGPEVSPEIQGALIRGLFGTLPVFAGGVVNTLIVAMAVAFRQPTLPFFIWFGLELAICGVRLIVLMLSRRAAASGRPTPTDLYLLLGCAWSASIGYGVFISITSGDWVCATLACFSAAGMVGGICFRNFSAPRLAGAMTLLSLVPSIPAAIIAREPLLYVVFAQIPMYLVAMTATASRLNRMLIATMRAERDNEHQARHDALSGLRNRLGLDDVFLSKTGAIRDGAARLAVLFLDLDGFKAVNDTYGHAAGDRLLKIVAQRLEGALRANDVIARIGGDEFVVLASVAETRQAEELCGRLIELVRAPINLGFNIVTKVGVSIGIAMRPEHGSELADLLVVADAALYEAKSHGRLRYRVGSVQTNVTSLKRLLPAKASKPTAAA